MKTSYKGKWILHCHHDILYEPATEPLANRIRYIKDNKPQHEQKIRLKVIRYLTKEEVKNIPIGIFLVGTAHDKAKIVHYKAWVAYSRAWTAYNKAEVAYDKAGAAYGKAKTAYYKAEAAYDKAWAAYSKTEIVCNKAWHDKICKVKDCPWNGKTLFPNT